MSYDVDATTVNTVLQNSNPVVFSDDTISKILGLTTQPGNNNVTFNEGAPDANGNVTVPAGTEVALVNTSNTSQTTVNVQGPNAPVLIFQGRGGVVATISDPSATVPGGNQTQVDRVVVGSAGNDNITVLDAKNTQIILGTGDSTVHTGRGVDTVEAGLGNSTITGGTGDYAVVKLAGNAGNYTVTTASNNSHAIVTDMTTGKTTDISKIQYVALDNDQALIFAKNSVEGQVANLYQTVFGRTAEAGGLDYWFDVAKAGASTKQIATSFVNSTEFSSKHPASETNTDFIQSLYQNTFNRAGEDAGVAYWLDQMTFGKTKADLVLSFAEIALQNILHTAPNQEAQIVGSVNVIGNII